MCKEEKTNKNLMHGYLPAELDDLLRRRRLFVGGGGVSFSLLRFLLLFFISGLSSDELPGTET